MRDPARTGAAIAGDRASYPLVLLSPGNATNVGFYATIAEELASRGYVVAGVDHPFQSAAVLLGDGAVATYDGDAPPERAEEMTAARITERVADLRRVLDALAELGPQVLEGRIDLTTAGVVGPIGAAPAAPAKPYLFLTKDADLHPTIAAAFETAGHAGHDCVRVIVPDAAHDQFADGPMFTPTLSPWPGTARNVATLTRGFALAFFDRALRGAPVDVLGEVPAPIDVGVEVYPLRPA